MRPRTRVAIQQRKGDERQKPDLSQLPFTGREGAAAGGSTGFCCAPSERLLGAGLLTPPQCPIEGRPPSECALRARIPLKPGPTISAGDLRSSRGRGQETRAQRALSDRLPARGGAGSGDPRPARTGGGVRRPTHSADGGAGSGDPRTARTGARGQETHLQRAPAQLTHRLFHFFRLTASPQSLR